MNLELIWKNRNPIPVTTEIYRGDQELDRENLGTPLVTLTNQETRWVDQTVDRGKLYYYVFVTISAVDRNVSKNYPMRALPRRGPGPQDILIGDTNLGYFGAIPNADFISSTRLLELLGMTGATGTFNHAGITKWHKYIRDGKVILFPNQVMSTANLTGKMLYEYGVMFGVNGNGTFVPTGSTPTNQNKRITVDADTFIVRCPHGWGTDTDLPTGNVTEPAGRSEWSDLIYPLFPVVPDSQTLPNVQPLSDLPATGLGIVTTSSVICQDLMGGSTSLLCRGSAYTSGSSSRQPPMYVGGKAPTVTAVSWLPFLELVEE